MSRTRTAVASLLLLGTLQLACYGRFGLTRSLYDWNGRVSGNKVVQSVVMWALIVIPVYEVVGFVDFIILNPVEFFTGSNPVAAKDGTPIAMRRLPDGSIESRHGGHVFVHRKGADGRVEVLRDGNLVLRYSADASGGVTQVEDQTGRVIADVQLVPTTLAPGVGYAQRDHVRAY